MPLTGESIGRAMRENKQPLKKGEEGILHPIQLSDQEYFAKVWRGKHFDNYSSLSYETEANKTSVSPFWHKVKFYEGVLLSDAFPEQTLRVHAAFEPRIKNEPDKVSFTYESGRPITVTKKVQGEEGVQKKRDEIMDAFYDDHLPSFKPDEKGILRNPDVYASILKIADADIKMQSIFGKILSFQNFREKNPTESLLRIAQEIRAEYPKSSLAEMCESGLVPAHPTFNFIPTKENNEHGPQGVFIEVAIADLDLLRKKLLSTCESEKDRSSVERKIGRYVLFSTLDKIYDNLFISQHKASAPPSLRNDSAVVNEVWKKLELARQKIDKKPPESIQRYLGTLYSELENFLEKETDKDSLLQKISNLDIDFE